MQLAYFGIFPKKNVRCLVLLKKIRYTLIRQLLQELSDQDILYLQYTHQGATRTEWVKMCNVRMAGKYNNIPTILIKIRHSKGDLLSEKNVAQKRYTLIDCLPCYRNQMSSGCLPDKWIRVDPPERNISVFTINTQIFRVIFLEFCCQSSFNEDSRSADGIGAKFSLLPRETTYAP